MKKYFNFAFASAIALIGTCGFTACSSSEDAAEVAQVPDNPTYDAVAQTVKTQFVLNVSSAANDNATRQSADIVQKNSNFRGMQDAKLIALATTKPTFLAPFNGEASAAFDVHKTFELGTLYGSSAVTAGSNQTSSSNRILELAMPLKTDAMLVYARAIPSGNDEENGKVTMNVTDAPESSTFSLVSRLSDRGTEYSQTCDLGATILNRIISANVTGAAAGDFTHNGYKNTGALPALDWKTMSEAYDGGAPTSALAEILAKAYLTLTTVRDGELRAGSGSALFNIAYSLYNTAKTVYAATATDDGEANAQRLASEIMDRIKAFFNIDADNNVVSEWKSIGNASETGTIIANLISAGIITSANWSEKFGQVKSGDLRNLPTVFGLPFGAAILYKKTDGTFDYRNPGTSLMEQNKTTAAANYMYPAELLYFDNSALRVNDEEQKVSDYPNGVTPWDTETSWTSKGWKSGAEGIVSSTTRSVAVKNNINYGVAMLQTKVSLAGTSFPDNRHAIIPEEADQSLTADDVKKFKLTGVLIGGQNGQVGWNYLAKDDDWNYVIYDSKIAGTGAIPTPSGEENYTLVFDNYTLGTGAGSQADQTSVLVALEFENQSKDFYGNGNMVRYGGKFYLVGKLVLGDNRIAADNWPTYYAIPPYDNSGATNKISRVFIQDFMTTANFKIGSNSLKNAFVTVPDLRSSQTSLGLSVDLQWQTGLSFESVLGGREE